MSSGATVRRSMTSTEMPSSNRRSAAATASCTIRETETTVDVGFPDVTRLAESDECRRRLRSFHPVEQPFSMKTTGFGSWIAARSSP